MSYSSIVYTLVLIRRRRACLAILSATSCELPVSVPYKIVTRLSIPSSSSSDMALTVDGVKKKKFSVSLHVMTLLEVERKMSLKS